MSLTIPPSRSATACLSVATARRARPPLLKCGDVPLPLGHRLRKRADLPITLRYRLGELGHRPIAFGLRSLGNLRNKFPSPTSPHFKIRSVHEGDHQFNGTAFTFVGFKALVDIENEMRVIAR